MNYVKHIGLAWLVCCVAGCGGDDGPKVYPVTGKVTIDGQPAADLFVHFTGGGTDGSGVSGTDGTFTVTSGSEGKPGLAPGTYQVYLQSKGGGPSPGGEGGYDPTAGGSTDPFPKKWGAAGTTPLSVEVKTEATEVNVEVKKE